MTARTSLKAALDDAGAADLQDAEDQYAKRLKLLEQATLARQEADLHAPATDDYEAGAQPLADYIEGLRDILARDKDELGLNALPSRQEAQAALTAADDDARQARHDVETARAALAGPDETLDRLRTELATVTARYEQADARLKKLREQCAQAEQERPDEQLRSAIDAARTAVAEQEKAVSDLEGAAHR